MNIIIKTTPEELKRAQKWWADLEMQWKMAYNEAVFGKGPVMATPKDEELMVLLLRADTLRFAGPLAIKPNMTTILTNLSGLVPLYHLTYLSLTNTNITSLRELKRHTKLEHLFVYDNKLTSIEGIEGMKGLKNFYFQNNQVTDLSPLKKLKNLEVIYATNNKMTALNGLSEKNTQKLKKFYIMPNEGLPDREIIKFQNTVGILCSKG